jgi:hypothetical protein
MRKPENSAKSAPSDTLATGYAIGNGAANVPKGAALQGKSHLCIPFFWELHGLSSNFHIHVSVSDLYIPRIRPLISRSRIGRPILEMYKSLTEI